MDREDVEEAESGPLAELGRDAVAIFWRTAVSSGMAIASTPSSDSAHCSGAGRCDVLAFLAEEASSRRDASARRERKQGAAGAAGGMLMAIATSKGARLVTLFSGDAVESMGTVVGGWFRQIGRAHV